MAQNKGKKDETKKSLGIYNLVKYVGQCKLSGDSALFKAVEGMKRLLYVPLKADLTQVVEAHLVLKNYKGLDP